MVTLITLCFFFSLNTDVTQTLDTAIVSILQSAPDCSALCNSNNQNTVECIWIYGLN